MGDTVACDHPLESREYSLRIWAWGLLTDWRYWAVAVGCSILGAVISSIGSGMGWTSGYIGGGAMAGLGIYTALTMGRISKCGRCAEIVRVPLGTKIPSSKSPPS